MNAWVCDICGQQFREEVDLLAHLFNSSCEKDLNERVLSITGHTSDIGEALDEFECVKQAVSELFGENQVLSKMNEQLILTLSFSTQAIDVLERETGMFITPRARKWIAAYREQMQKIEAARVKSKLVTQKVKE